MSSNLISRLKGLRLSTIRGRKNPRRGDQSPTHESKNRDDPQNFQSTGTSALEDSETRNSEKGECYILRLPREIREQIYRYYVDAQGLKHQLIPKVYLNYDNFTDPAWEYPPSLTNSLNSLRCLAQVSKLFFMECRELYFRDSGIKFDIKVEHSSSNPWAKTNTEITYWRLPFLKWIRQLNLTIYWRCEDDASCQISTAELLQTVNEMIAPFLTLSSLDLTFLLPATHLEDWPDLSKPTRIDLTALFDYRPPGPRLPHLRVAVRAYYREFGQDIDHRVYERKEFEVGNGRWTGEEDGDWKVQHLYPELWDELIEESQRSRRFEGLSRYTTNFM